MPDLHETPYSPTVRRLRLAGELRRLRDQAGLTAARASQLSKVPATKLSRLELGTVDRPKPADVSALLATYGVTDPARQASMLAWARDTRMTGWWRGYRDVFRGVLPDLEFGASEIRTYEALHIPGLLQTRAYAEAVLRVEETDDAALARRINARMARQKILERDELPAIHAVIDESALQKCVGGPATMSLQLAHLVQATSRQPQTCIQVVTHRVGAHPGMNAPSFVVLRFPSPDDPHMVFLESAENSLCLEGSSDVGRYESIFERLCSVALSAGESLRFMADLADRFATEGGEG